MTNNLNTGVQPGEEPQVGAAVGGEPTGNRLNHAEVRGVLDLDLLKRTVAISVGANRQAKFWENRTGTVADILDLLTKFEVGEKDGKAILQGALVESGERRKEAQHT